MFFAPYSFSFAAPSAPVTIDEVTIAPEVIASGGHPDILADIKSTSRAGSEVAVIAVLTRPDHVVKSWRWGKVVVSPNEKQSIALPKEYDTKLIGVYKVEFVIYSVDMSRRIHALSRIFTVAEPAKVQPMMEQPARKEPEQKMAPAQERTYLGIGLYGNGFNPAGGATVLLWPFRNIGLQGIYTVGVFTSYEGRLLLKFETASGVNPYLGAGFLTVSTEKKVTDVDTTFEDSTVSGVVGIEMRLGRRGRGYLEVSGADIKLEKDVTNGAQTAHATVKYIPVTIGLGLVWSVF